MSDVSRELEMQNALENIRIDHLSDFFAEFEDVFLENSNSFSNYMRKKFKEKKISQKEVFQRASIPTRYGYKLISEEKRSGQRDVIIRLGLSLHMNVSELQKALVLSNFMGLDMLSKRDVIIMVLINNEIFNIDEVNKYLAKFHEKKLYCCATAERKDVIMKKYRIELDGELQEEIFDTYDDADEYAGYLVSCSKLGAELLEMSNPGDYPMDDYVASEYEIIEVEE